MRFVTPAFGGGFFLPSLDWELRVGCPHNASPSELSTAEKVMVCHHVRERKACANQPIGGLRNTTAVEMVDSEKKDG